jgi:hypothetical protein
VTRTVLRYGLWLIRAPKGAQDPRVFYEDNAGDWPISLQQRSLGISLHAPGIYGRSFARMGNWKGFYLTASKAGPLKTTRELILGAKKNLGLSTSAPHKLFHSRLSAKNASGYAVLAAPRLRFIRNPPLGCLLAVIYARREKVAA